MLQVIQHGDLGVGVLVHHPAGGHHHLRHLLLQSPGSVVETVQEVPRFVMLQLLTLILIIYNFRQVATEQSEYSCRDLRHWTGLYFL